MKTHRKLAVLFAALGALLSHAMWAVTAYQYCALQWGGQYAGYSAPPEVAFLLAAPYGIGILLCGALARYFWKRGQAL